jgi:hypothetical protein
MIAQECRRTGQGTNSHINLPSKVKVLQTKSNMEDPAGLAA